MKTIKIILSIAGFTLSSFCFGQLPSKYKDDPLFYSSYYNLTSNRMEHRIEPFPGRTDVGDYFEAPHISITYFVPTEFDMDLEVWMSKPFESSFYEAEVLLEPWMTEPFESGNAIDDEIEIESWMTSPWV